MSRNPCSRVAAKFSGEPVRIHVVGACAMLRAIVCAIDTDPISTSSPTCRCPAGDGPFPVAVVLHAGFWREQYTLELSEELARDLTRRGWATWNVEFRRLGPLGQGGYPTTLEDAGAAIDALAGTSTPRSTSSVS